MPAVRPFARPSTALGFRTVSDANGAFRTQPTGSDVRKARPTSAIAHAPPTCVQTAGAKKMTEVTFPSGPGSGSANDRPTPLPSAESAAMEADPAHSGEPVWDPLALTDRSSPKSQVDEFVYAALCRSHFGSLMTEQQLRVLASGSQLVRVNAGEVIGKEKQRNPPLKLLVSGTVGEYTGTLQSTVSPYVAVPAKLAPKLHRKLTATLQCLDELNAFLGQPS